MEKLDKYEIMDVLEEIQDRNEANHMGNNEANLMVREEVSDYIIKLLATRPQVEITEEEIRSYLENEVMRCTIEEDAEDEIENYYFKYKDVVIAIQWALQHQEQVKEDKK